MINIDDFSKVEITVGKVVAVEKVPDTTKLLKLTVSFGGDQTRQIISGIAQYFADPQEIVGIKCPFVTNLEPRMIKGLESNGMIMGASTPNKEDGSVGVFSFLRISEDIPEGTRIN